MAIKAYLMTGRLQSSWCLKNGQSWPLQSQLVDNLLVSLGNNWDKLNEE